MSGTATAIHNARITLLATLINNIALAFIVAGFVAPTVTGQLRGGWHTLVTLAWVGLGAGLHYAARVVLGVAAMTWDLALTWFVMPAVVALIVGVGGIWLAKHTP